MTSKQELRQQMRLAARQHVGAFASPADVGSRTVAALQRIPCWAEASTVLAYCSLPDEVPTASLLDRLLAEGRQVLLPRVASDTELTIHRYTSPADLQPGAFGILEPVGEPVADCTIADAAIIPGMAFDREGHRLGRGRGFYDRFLARVPQLLRIGLCAEWQLADFVPTDAHDVAMHYVVAVGAQSATLHIPHSTFHTPHSTLHIPHEKHSSHPLVASPAGQSPRH